MKVLSPDIGGEEIRVGPALFGPDLGDHEFQVRVGTFSGLMV